MVEEVGRWNRRGGGKESVTDIDIFLITATFIVRIGQECQYQISFTLSTAVYFTFFSIRP